MPNAVSDLRLLRRAEPARSAPRPSFVTAAGRFDLEALMQFAHAEARANVARAAHFRRQQDNSRSLLAGMFAEREIRAACAPQHGHSAAEVLADLSAAIDRAGATR